MKVLMIFIDMVKGVDLSKNKSKMQTRAFKNYLDKLGGTIFTNTFTEGPDTPRSMSSFYTGKKPSENGCIDRLRWPEYFLNTEETIFDYFIDNNFKLDFFSNPNERANGLFPKKISQLKNVHNETINLNHFIDELTLSDDQLLFISLPDLHFSMDDIGYNLLGEFYGYYNVIKSLNIIFNRFHKDIFDNILIFSDHGFKYRSQLAFEKRSFSLNRDRTQVFLFSRNKFDNSINYSENLLALSDVFHVFRFLKKDINIDLIQNLISFKRDYILIEDHSKFNNEYGQFIGKWAYVNSKHYYIRNQENAILIDLESEKVIEGYNKFYENELLALKSFREFHDVSIKLNQYNTNILVPSIKYTSGIKRIKFPF